MMLFASSYPVFLPLIVLGFIVGMGFLLLTVNLSVRLFRSRRRQRKHELTKRWDRQLGKLRDGQPVSRLEFPENPASLATVVSVWNRYARKATPGQLTRLRSYAGEVGLLERVETVLDQLSPSKRCVLIRALGLFGDSRSWPLVKMGLRDRNLFLKIASSRALIRINAGRALPLVFEMIEQNRTIQPAQLEDLVSVQDPALVSDSLDTAVEDHTTEERYHLISYFRFGEPERSREWLVGKIHDCWRNNEHVARCLKTLSYFDRLKDVNLLTNCAERSFWPIRMHTAACLGQVQREDAVDILTDLLGDEEWWVRRHAAEALYQHDCVTDEQYQALVDSYGDAYGRDMLREVRSGHEASDVKRGA